MKLTGPRIEGFLRKPDPLVTAVLLYGPDLGLIRERAERLIVAVAGDSADPFRIAEVNADSLKDDHARLADEAAALPFSGGRKVVRIRDARETIVAAVKNLLEAENIAGFVVVDAGELGPRSALRQLFEAAKQAVALPCYLDEGEALRKVIAEGLAVHGLAATEDAADLLTAHLGADRGLTRSELEKLSLYKGEPGRVDADDVMAIVGEAGAVSLDAIAFAACGGDFAELDHNLTKATAEGLTAIPLLRAASRHVQRLLQARVAVATGKSPRQAMETLKPAVFFRLQTQFVRQIERWHPAQLANALGTLADAEMQCKRTGAPQALLCHRALLHLAELARASNRRP